MEWIDFVRPLISYFNPVLSSRLLTGLMNSSMYLSRERFVSFSLCAI